MLVPLNSLSVPSFISRWFEAHTPGRSISDVHRGQRNIRFCDHCLAPSESLSKAEDGNPQGQLLHRNRLVVRVAFRRWVSLHGRALRRGAGRVVSRAQAVVEDSTPTT